MKLIHQIGHLASANILFLLSQLGVLMALTRLTDLQTVAAFGFVMAVVQPLLMLALMGFRTNIATDAMGEHNLPSFITLQAINSSLLFFVAIAIIAVVRPEYLPLALPLALQKSVETFSTLSYGAMQKSGRVQLVARSLFIRGPAALLLFTIVLWLTRSASIAFWTQTIVWVSVQIFHDFPALRALGEKISFDLDAARLWKLAVSSVPLGLGQFFAALQISLPRIFVDVVLGPQAMALFTAVSYLQRAAMGVFQSLEQAIGWRLSRIWAAGDQVRFFTSIRKVLLMALAVGLIAFILAVLIGEPFLEAAYGPEYASAYSLLLWIVIAISLRFLSSVLQTAVTAQRRFSEFGTVQLVVLVFIIPVTWGGMTLYGLEGVGMAIAATAVLRTVIFAMILARR